MNKKESENSYRFYITPFGLKTSTQNDSEIYVEKNGLPAYVDQTILHTHIKHEEMINAIFSNKDRHIQHHSKFLLMA